MSFTRTAITSIGSMAIGLTVLSAPALAQNSPTAFERAMLAELDESTRAGVESRVTGGNTVMGVIGTTLLNNYYETGARSPGEGLTIVAVDFSRGAAVVRRDTTLFEVLRFDPRTLRILR